MSYTEDLALVKAHCVSKGRDLTSVSDMLNRQFNLLYTKNGKRYAAIVRVEYDQKARTDVVVVLRGGEIK